MPRTLQFKRYTEAQLAGIVGASGELIVDTTNKTLTVHDGATLGGVKLAKQVDLLSNNAVSATKLVTARNINGIAFDGTTNITIPTIIPSYESISAFPNTPGVYQIGTQLHTSDGTNLSIGYLGVPPKAISATSYTLDLSVSGTNIYHTNADTLALTIPSNAGTPFPVGTSLVIINDVGAGVITLNITSDTLVWAATGGTGSRTFTAFAMASLIKVAPTRWIISGTGLS